MAFALFTSSVGALAISSRVNGDFSASDMRSPASISAQGFKVSGFSLFPVRSRTVSASFCARSSLRIMKPPFSWSYQPFSAFARSFAARCCSFVNGSTNFTKNISSTLPRLVVYCVGSMLYCILSLLFGLACLSAADVVPLLPEDKSLRVLPAALSSVRIRPPSSMACLSF